MARRESVDVDVDFQARGLGQLKGKWMDFAGDLLEPVVLLAAGATKAQAAWAGMRGMFEARVLGPMGLVAGASLAFLGTTKLLVNKWKELGMAGAGALERMTLQFRPLLGSMDRARERVKELQSFAVKTPFEINEIVEANKQLEVLTKGALSGEKGMTLVGDASAVAGESFTDTARQVGRLYDGLMSGRPVGEATMRLQEMGIISGSVRNQMESMQASGASGIEIWKVMEKQLDRNKGAMDELSTSLEGLQSTHADTKNQLESGFSKGFLEGEKAGTEAAIKTMEALTPVMANLGNEIGAMENRWAKWKLGVVEAVTENRAFSGTVEWMVKGMVGLAAVVAGASSVAIAGFTVKLLMLMAGNKAVAASSVHLARIQSAQIPVMVKLRAIKQSLAAANAASAAGLRAEAGAHLGAAAASARNLAATNGMMGVVGLGRKAMWGFGLAIRFVASQLKAAAVAMLANPMVWFAALVVGLGMAFSKLNAVQKEAKERLEGYMRATAALDSSMKKQIADIRTMVDLRQAENKILTELVGAYKSVEGAKNDADKDAATKRVSQLKENLKSLPGTGGLEKTDSQMAMEQKGREGAEQKREMERDAISAKGPEDALRIADARLDEANRKRREAIGLIAEEEAAEKRGAAARQAAADPYAKMESLLAKKAQLLEKIAGYDKADASMPDFGLNQALSTGSRNELDRVNSEIAGMKPATPDGQLAEMLGSPSELQRIKAKIAVMDELRAATDAVTQASEDLAQNEDEKKSGGLQAAMLSAEMQREKAAKLAGEAGVGDTDARGRQEMVRRRDDLESKRGEDMDPAKVKQLEQEAAKAKQAAAEAVLDAEMVVAGLRLKGFDRESKMLEMEREKLNLKLRGDAIGQKEYDRQEREIALREEVLSKEAGDRRNELSGALEVSKLKRLEEEARLKGDTGAAEALRKRADAVDDAFERKDAERDAESVTADPGQRKAYVENRMAERAKAREGERKREEEERAEGRKRSVAGLRGGLAGMQADLLRRQGKGKEAKALKEQAAREDDELNRTEARKKFIGQGFGAKEAERMANQEVKLSQADRMMQDLTGQRGTVVASTLSQIGGGGGVRGTDPEQRLLERIAKIMEDVRDQGKKNVDSDGML